MRVLEAGETIAVEGASITVAAFRRPAPQDGRHQQPVGRRALRERRKARAPDGRRERGHGAGASAGRPSCRGRMCSRSATTAAASSTIRGVSGSRLPARRPALLRPREPLRPSRSRDAGTLASAPRPRLPDRSRFRLERRAPAGRHPRLPGGAPMSAATAAFALHPGPHGRGQERASLTRSRSQRGGEIVSADAFAVYRGFDIGTAKPGAERARRGPLPPDRRGRSRRDILGGALGHGSAAGDRGDRPPRPAPHRVRRERLLRRGARSTVSRPARRSIPAGARGLAAWGEANPGAARRLLEINDPVSAARIRARRTCGTSCGRSRSCSRPARPPRQGPRPGGGLSERWRVDPARPPAFARGPLC